MRLFLPPLLPPFGGDGAIAAPALTAGFGPSMSGAETVPFAGGSSTPSSPSVSSAAAALSSASETFLSFAVSRAASLSAVVDDVDLPVLQH